MTTRRALPAFSSSHASFGELEDRPRGIVFAAFAGEELGLRGSYHYTANARNHLEDAVAMINLDMIGRLRHKRLFIGGAELVPGLRQTLERLTGDEELTYSTRFSAASASDHASFIRAGVPALLFFTGLHGDYHKPTDDPLFVNVEGMEQVLRVSYNLSDHLLRASRRPMLTPTRASGDPELVSPSRDGEGLLRNRRRHELQRRGRAFFLRGGWWTRG